MSKNMKFSMYLYGEWDKLTQLNNHSKTFLHTDPLV